jgi:beta-aspartyl-peptidase (threonine type)
MDGRTLAAGAVAAIKGYRHPIEIARKVMESTPHVMLVGDGAELFAERNGFERAELLTPEAEAIWRERIAGGAPTGSNLYADSYQLYMAAVRDWAQLLHDRIFGTTNVIVRDAAGDIASAVSTSGWGFKWPGRVGDSPIIGAGNYADNRYGAAGCTGRGELAIRAATAYSIVRYLRDGVQLDEALCRAMLDLRDLVDPFAERVNVMNAVAMDRDGNVAAVSTAPDTFYVFQTLEMPEPEGLQAALPIGLHVIGEHRVHQQRHVTTDIMEDVGLLEIIELIAPPNKAGRREPAARQVGEKDVIRNKPGNRHDPPAGRRVENLAQPAEIGDAIRRNTELVQPVEKFATGALC